MIFSLEKFQELNKLLEEKSLTYISSYREKSAKTNGVTSGYIAKKDDDLYMVKNSNSNKISLSEKEISEKNDFLSEFIVAPLYKRLLFDRAPEIGISNDSNNQELYLRSKFVKGFNELNTYERDLKKNVLGLRKIDGFEKAIVASLFLGDPDYHNENVGVSIQEGSENSAVKIDHGRSLSEMSNSADHLMNNFINRRLRYKYDDIQFDVHKFNIVAQSVADISDEEIEKYISSQVYKLQQYGFFPPAKYYEFPLHTPIIYGEEPLDNQVSLTTLSISKISIKIKDHPEAFLEIIDQKVMLTGAGREPQVVPKITSKDLKLLSVSIKRKNSGETEEMKMRKHELLEVLDNLGLTKEKKYRFQTLERLVVEQVKTHKIFFQELIEKTNIIEKIDINDPKFKKSDWISEIFSTVPSQNPVYYALEKGLTIEGKKPLEWLIESDHATEKNNTVKFLISALEANNNQVIKDYFSQVRNEDESKYLIKYLDSQGSKEFSKKLLEILQQQQNKPIEGMIFEAENIHPNIKLQTSLVKEIKKLGQFNLQSTTKNKSSDENISPSKAKKNGFNRV